MKLFKGTFIFLLLLEVANADNNQSTQNEPIYIDQLHKSISETVIEWSEIIDTKLSSWLENNDSNTTHIEANVTDKTVFIVDDILDSGNTMKAVSKFLSVKEPKTITPVAAIYKENLDFDKVLHILKQDTDSMFDPWYIGYGMDDENGHNRNLGTIYII